MSRKIGLILAGGLGSRLGGIRKADLRIGGVRLLDRVANVLAEHVDQLLVSSGRKRPLMVPNGATLIEDESDETQGPLAGIRAAIAGLQGASETDILISAAVDTPFLPASYVPRLVESLGRSSAAFSSWGGQFYPTSAAWRMSALRAALAEIPGQAGPKAALNFLGAQQVDWTADAALNPFANVNTLADLIALQRRTLASDELPYLPGS